MNLSPLIRIFWLIITVSTCHAEIPKIITVEPGFKDLEVKLQYFSQSKSGYNLGFSIPKKSLNDKFQGLLLIQSARKNWHLISRAVLDAGDKKDIYYFRFFLSEEASKSAFLQVSHEHGPVFKYKIDIRAYIEEAKKNETKKMDNKSQ